VIIHKLLLRLLQQNAQFLLLQLSLDADVEVGLVLADEA
jgi:hypothetical protein